MSKSILVIDTKDLKDIFITLTMNEMYLEVNHLKDSITSKDTTGLLEALVEFGNNKYDFGVWSGVNKMKKDYVILENKLHKALGGKQ